MTAIGTMKSTVTRMQKIIARRMPAAKDASSLEVASQCITFRVKRPHFRVLAYPYLCRGYVSEREQAREALVASPTHVDAADDLNGPALRKIYQCSPEEP